MSLVYLICGTLLGVAFINWVLQDRRNMKSIKWAAEHRACTFAGAGIKDDGSVSYDEIMREYDRSAGIFRG